MFFIILDIIKSVLKISFALLKRISSFAQIFIFFVLQIFLPWEVNKYTSYWLNSNDFSFKLFTKLCVSFVVEFLSFNVLLIIKIDVKMNII